MALNMLDDNLVDVIVIELCIQNLGEIHKGGSSQINYSEGKK